MPSKDYLIVRSAQQGASRSTHHLAATPLFDASVNFLRLAIIGFFIFAGFFIIAAIEIILGIFVIVVARPQNLQQIETRAILLELFRSPARKCRPPPRSSPPRPA
jgi:hypothetical protein